MNRQILFYICILLSTNLLAQKYHPFPKSEENPLWGVLVSESGPWGPVVDSTIYRMEYLTMIGDTIIGAYSYSKVYQISDTSLNSNSEKHYICGIREDSDSSIYRINMYSQSENKLFDYSLEIEDTASLATDIDHPWLIEVYEKNEILLNTEIYTEYLTTYYTWIDGIGNLSNGIDGYEVAKPADRNISKQLIAFKKNNRLIYGEYLINAINKYTGIISSSGSKKIQIYPNPANNLLTICLKDKTNAYSLDLLNGYGSHILSKDFEGLQELIISVSHLPSGIYYVRIQNNAGAQMVRRIILR